MVTDRSGQKVIWLAVGIAVAVVSAGALIMFLVPELSLPGEWTEDAGNTADREQCMSDVRLWCQRNQNSDWSNADQLEDCVQHSDYISGGSTRCSDVLEEDT